MVQLLFPDAPLSPQEVRDSLRFGGLSVPKRRFVFEEEYEGTRRVTVEARDEDEAQNLYDTGRGIVRVDDMDETLTTSTLLKEVGA